MLDRLEAEHENLRVALGWSLEHQEAATAAQIGAGIFRFWLLRGYLSEGRRFLERALGGFSEKNEVRAKALNVAAILASLQDDYPTAKTLAEENFSVKPRAGLSKQVGYALYILGRLAHLAGNYADAVTCYEESLTLFRALGDRKSVV